MLKAIIFSLLSTFGLIKDPPLSIPDLRPQQISCLAQNIYHESRGEPLLGQESVAFVTLNRANSKSFPDQICAVVNQGPTYANGMLQHNRCQFSWVCDGKRHTIKETNSWCTAVAVAVTVDLVYNPAYDPTHGALFYHTARVKSSRHYKLTGQIGHHKFYTLRQESHAKNFLG